MHQELNNFTYISNKYLKQIKKMTEPLQSQFGITYFAKQTVTHDGHWKILGNLPEWLEHSAENEFYQFDPSLMDPNLYQSGLTVISSNHVPAFLHKMAKEALDIYDIEHCLCISEKTTNGCEWYFFATSSKNMQIFNTYITQIHSIYKYIKYFNLEAKKIENKNLDYQINIAAIKKATFHGHDRAISLSPLPEVKNDSLSLVGPDFSPRERECLKLFLTGKTIKETAQALRLSPRTIEEYLNRLKAKTGCKYKRELMSIL